MYLLFFHSHTIHIRNIASLPPAQSCKCSHNVSFPYLLPDCHSSLDPFIMSPRQPPPPPPPFPHLSQESHPAIPPPPVPLLWLTRIQSCPSPLTRPRGSSLPPSPTQVEVEDGFGICEASTGAGGTNKLISSRRTRALLAGCNAQAYRVELETYLGWHRPLDPFLLFLFFPRSRDRIASQASLPASSSCHFYFSLAPSPCEQGSAPWMGCWDSHGLAGWRHPIINKRNGKHTRRPELQQTNFPHISVWLRPRRCQSVFSSWLYTSSRRGNRIGKAILERTLGWHIPQARFPLPTRVSREGERE